MRKSCTLFFFPRCDAKVESYILKLLQDEEVQYLVWGCKEEGEIEGAKKKKKKETEIRINYFSYKLEYVHRKFSVNILDSSQNRTLVFLL